MNRLVILFHGYGGKGSSLKFLSNKLEKRLNNYCFTLLEGIEPFEKDVEGVVGSGRQWFSLVERDLNVLQYNIELNIHKIRHLIADTQKMFNVTNMNTILMGFSQGAMLSQYIAIDEEHEPYNAVISFNGALVPPKHVRNSKTPIVLISGSSDDVIEEKYFEENFKYLDSNFIPNKKILIENLGHRINDKSIDFCCEFLQEINL